MIKLQEIIDGIDEQWEESRNYYDRETEELFYLSGTTADEIESRDIDELSGWEKEIAKTYALIQEDEEKAYKNKNYKRRFIALPGKFEVDEYHLMERFSLDQPVEISEELLNVIRGKGAFRYFKDTIDRIGLRDEWFKYKADYLGELAKEFCEANEIEYAE